MRTGVQFTGTLAAGASQRFFTFGWSSADHIVWYMVPTTARPGAPGLEWDVAVERADAARCTYWITVKNLTTGPVTFEGRYAVLS
jgi:hypothetical protein